MPEGAVLSRDETLLYLDERNTHNIVVLRVARTSSGITLAPEGAPIERLASDPMPMNMRLGQRLFYDANSAELHITRNNWVACASCHVEGRSDAVVWLFEQGPRDTPSNAGGMLETGFMFRTADRNSVRDYWHTINIEQGGMFDPTNPDDSMWLDALTAYVNYAIPLPVPPHTDAQMVARGNTLFHDPTIGCSGCHSGPAFTDSGSGNSMLDLGGVVVLHEVGTCVTAPGMFDDVAHTDVQNHPRQACQFDTPSLRGISDSAPYFHSGTANTLREVLDQTRGTMGNTVGLPDSDLNALVEYMRSL
jgi:cytochrome c peroxidase